MFKGFNKKFQKELEKNNQDSSRFYFSFMDLELVEVNGKRRKYRILSEEVREKLHKLVSGGPKPTFVEFNSWSSIDYRLIYPDCIQYWMEINKYEKPEWKKYRKGLKDLKVSQDGVLSIEYFEISSCVKEIDDFYGSVHDNEWGEYTWGYRKPWDDRGGWTVSGGYGKIHSGYDEKTLQTSQARTSAIQAIENTIKNGNIDSTTLKDAIFFLDESYVNSRPIDCLHCSDPEELVPGREADFYQTHINKCLWRPDRINDFKDSQIALLKRIITKFNDYKKDVIQQVIEEAQEQGISEDQLNNNRSGWQNTLLSLTNREIFWEYITDQLEADIKRLVDAKKKSGEERQRAEAEAKEKAKKEEARLKKEREEQEKKVKEEKTRKATEEKKRREQEAKKQAEEKVKAKQQELSLKRSKCIIEITTALNQEFSLTNSDLSPGYHNWETQINQLTDIQKINNFQERILADIGARWEEKKSAQEAKENLNKAKTGTAEEKKQAWENLEKQETQKGYQDNEEEIKNLKKEKAAENPQQYSENTKRIIEEKLKSNEVKEEELSAENIKELQKLKNGEIQSPDQLVAVETKIKQDIYQKEAVKKITVLTSQVKEILKSKSLKKSQIAAVKNELLKFISSGNIYHASQKKAVENLLAQLENYSVPEKNSAQNPHKLSLPTKILLGTGVSLAILVLVSVILVRKRVSKKAFGRKK